MSPDDLPPMPAPVDIGEQLTPEEQAQFDAMRSGGELPEAPPSPPPEPSPPPAPPAAGANGQNPPETPPAPSDDDDIEVAAPVTGTKQKRVSIHKFQRMEERARQFEEAAAQAAKERQELMERLTRTDERLKIINEALVTPPEQQQQQQDEDPPPNPQEDIFAYAEWQGRQINRLNERLSGLESGTQQQSQDTELAQTYQRDAAAFAQKEAAFADAYVYLFTQRDKELLLAGVTDERQRRQQIVNEEKGLVRGAIKQNRSPAELIFQMAMGRGFQKKAPPPPPAAPNGKDPNALDAAVANGGSPAPATPPATSPAAVAAPGSPAPATPPQSVTAEIEAIQRGQQAAASLSNVGGGAPIRELTSKVLADMPEEEFNKLVETLPRERLMELMGN